MKDKIELYEGIFKKTVEEGNYLKNSEQMLTKKGKVAYAKIYALYVAIIVTIYSTVVGFYFKGDLIKIGEKLIWILILLVIILWFFWVKLYDWINKVNKKEEITAD